MVPAGSSVLVQIAGQVTDFTTAPIVLGAVASELAKSNILVTDSRLDVPFVDLGTMFSFSTSYNASVTVKVGDDYSGADDVGHVVAQAFALVTGNAPTAVASTAANATVPTMAGPASSLASVGNSISSVFSGFQADVQTVLIGALVLLIFIVWALGWSPNGPALVPRA